MADFSYIREHPWITAGAIIGGGLIVYLIYEHFKGRSGSASVTTVDAA